MKADDEMSQKQRRVNGELMNIVVIKGPAAIRVERYWIAVLSGDAWLPKRFRTSEAALKYGAKREKPD